MLTARWAAAPARCAAEPEAHAALAAELAAERRHAAAALDAMRSPAGNPTLFSSTGCPDSYFAAKN